MGARDGAGDAGTESLRSRLAALPGVAPCAAGLIGLGGVDAVKAVTDAVDVDGVGVNDAEVLGLWWFGGRRGWAAAAASGQEQEDDGEGNEDHKHRGRPSR